MKLETATFQLTSYCDSWTIRLSKCPLQCRRQLLNFGNYVCRSAHFLTTSAEVTATCFKFLPQFSPRIGDGNHKTQRPDRNGPKSTAELSTSRAKSICVTAGITVQSWEMFSLSQGIHAKMWMAAEPQRPPPSITNRNLKSTTFVDMMVLNILHDLTFSQNQLLKLADNKYNSILGARGGGVEVVLVKDVARQAEVAQGVPVGQGSGFSWLSALWRS